MQEGTTIYRMHGYLVYMNVGMQHSLLKMTIETTDGLLAEWQLAANRLKKHPNGNDKHNAYQDAEIGSRFNDGRCSRLQSGISDSHICEMDGEETGVSCIAIGQHADTVECECSSDSSGICRHAGGWIDCRL